MWAIVTAVALAGDPGAQGAPPAPPAPVPGPTPDPPLAIPAETPPPAPPGQGGRRGEHNGAHANAVRTYTREFLAVHSLAEYYVTPGMTTYYGTGWRHFGWGIATSTPTTIEQVDDWAIFEGEHQLDVPSYLGTIGDTGEKADLERRIRANRTAGTALEVFGGAGVAASIVGIIGIESATSNDQAVAWSDVSLVGLGSAVVGLLTGSFPSARAHRLFERPETTLDRHQVEDRVEQYNANLADQLGLSPDEAFRIEQGGPPRRGPPGNPDAP